MSSIETKQKVSDGISGYAAINGLKMYYEIHGKGSPLVLIHGGGSTIETSFGRVIHAFAEHRQVIAVELQAHGHTSDRDQPETFQQDADDVAALLHFLNIKHADIFGFSNGGQTTLEIAMRHPELVRKIILGSVAYNRDAFIPGFWEGMAHASLDNMPQQLKEAYLKVAPDPDGLINMFNKDKNRMLVFEGWKDEDIRSVTAPALIINGDKDVIRPEHAVALYRLLPNSQLAIIPGTHGQYIGEITTIGNNNPDRLFSVSLIEDFLDKE